MLDDLNPALPEYQRRGDLAIVIIDDQEFELGEYNSRESHLQYEARVCELIANVHFRRSDAAAQIRIRDLVEAYLDYAESYYGTKETSEIHRIRIATKPLVDFYGSLPANEFGPLQLRAVRQKWILAGNSRGYINANWRRVLRMFKWAAGADVVSEEIYRSLFVLPLLQRGRSPAPESSRIEPIDDASIEKTLRYLSPAVADMVRLQRLTGMRPGDVRHLRPIDVDQSDEVWVYRPPEHKTAYLGRVRTVLIGPKAQAVLAKYLNRPDDWYCFSPQESVLQIRFARQAMRKTPDSCGNKRGSKAKLNPKWKPGKMYSRSGYASAIAKACVKAGIERWGPNRLRHTAATEIRAKFDLEAAQVVLGHSKADVTQIYAERDLKKALEVVREIG